MEIKISKSNEKEIKKFNKREWKKPDIEHYGGPIRWVEKPLVFKVTEKRKMVGNINAKYEGGVVYIKNLIVAKEKRHQGIGRKLVEKVEKEGKRLGGHKIFLWTGKKWDTHNFYRKLGYKKPLICQNII